jgi:hypothetical protein
MKTKSTILICLAAPIFLLGSGPCQKIPAKDVPPATQFGPGFVPPTGEDLAKPITATAAATATHIDKAAAAGQIIGKELDKAPPASAPTVKAIRPLQETVVAEAAAAKATNTEVITKLVDLDSKIDAINKTQKDQLDERCRLLAERAAKAEAIATAAAEETAALKTERTGTIKYVWDFIGWVGGLLLVAGIGFGTRALIQGGSLKFPAIMAGAGGLLVILVTVLPSVLHTATQIVQAGLWIVGILLIAATISAIAYETWYWIKHRQFGEVVETVQRTIVDDATKKPSPQFAAIADAVQSTDTKAAVDAWQTAAGVKASIPPA